MGSYNYTYDVIQERLSRTNTLVENLQIIDSVREKNFVQDLNYLAEVIERNKSYERAPLFESKVQGPIMLSRGALDLARKTLQIHALELSSDVIESYRGNRVIDQALQGTPIYKIYNEDLFKWDETKEDYKKLIGPGRYPKSPPYIRPITVNEIPKPFHPISYLDKHLRRYNDQSNLKQKILYGLGDPENVRYVTSLKDF